MQRRRQGENRQVSPYFSFALRSKKASLRGESAVEAAIRLSETWLCGETLATEVAREQTNEPGVKSP